MRCRLRRFVVSARTLLGAAGTAGGSGRLVATGLAGPPAATGLRTAVSARAACALVLQGPFALSVSTVRSSTLVLVVHWHGCHIGRNLANECHNLG